MKLKDKLSKLDINLELEIRSGMSSIHLLDKEAKEYINLILEDSSLKKLTYIVYPNDNTHRNIVLLDNNGAVLKESESYMSKLVYKPLDFEIEYPVIQSKILDSYRDLKVDI